MTEYETVNDSNAVSVLIYIGIGVFVLPIVLGIVNIRIPFIGGWMSGLGILLIIAGAGHTIWMRK